MLAAPAAAASMPRPDWVALTARARARRRATTAFLYAILILGSLPIVVPYLWLFTVALSGRAGASTTVLWLTLAILMPALMAWLTLRATIEDERRRRRAEWVLAAVTVVALGVVAGPHLHSDNWRFLWIADIANRLKGETGTGGRYPSVWTAFGNSLFIALVQMALVVSVSTLAGYYLSRFEFRGREPYLRGLLILHAFPAMTLIIPIFLLTYWVGLLDTLTGVILVVVALELPFAIFVMKGFFDAVPWDIEMSGMVDGASRRQAFFMLLLPQVKVGMLAVGVFAFLRGWEEYVFVRTLLFQKSNWTMSLYLYFMSEDVMGTDYAMVSAIGVFYVLPSIVLYALSQKYLTQMTIGGIKG